jgi:outer membrane protein, heavy metal efflux system
LSHPATLSRTAFACGLVTVFTALLAGCQTYHPQPLSNTAVNTALDRPAVDALRMQASKISHPSLPPIQLHPEDGLTPDEAALIAVIANPDLRAARDQAAIAQAAVLQAKILPNPQFSYNYDFVTGGNVAGATNAYGWGLNYDVNTLLAHDAQVKSAEANGDSINIGIAWQEWQIAEAAKQAVYDLISLRAQNVVAEEIDQELQQNLQLLQKAEAERLKTALDLSAAETASRDAHATLLQVRRDAEHQRLLLNRALGVPADTEVRLCSTIALPTSFAVPSEDLLHDLDQRRLDLAALRSGYESQEQTLRAVTLNQLPRINLGFDRSSDDTGVHLAGPSITIDLPLFDRNQGVIATEKATRQKLFDEYVSRVFDARADIAEAIADVRSINDQIADAQAAIPSLQQLMQVYQQALNHGNADVLSYYTAWTDFSQKKLEVLKLQQQLADTKVALELASGRYFPDAAPMTNPTTQPQPGASAQASVAFTEKAQ